MTPAATDPYHHLHDERYAARFADGRVGAAQMLCIAGRDGEALDGQWDFVLDLHDEGLRQSWYADPPAAIADWRTPRDYDGGAWQRVPVPSCWNLLRPEWFYFEGSGWYARDIDHAAGAPGERLVLRIGAANYETRVFLNGHFAGAHRGGSTPFFVDLTATIRPGRNRLLIQVENRRRPDRVPMNHTDWFNYGGLYREVTLFRLPAVHIRDAVIALAPGSFSAIRASIELSEPVDGVATLEIAGLGGPWPIPVTAGRGTADIAAAPALWFPENPVLHRATVRFGADAITERVGFREVRVEGTRILLNGHDVFLRGIAVHEDDLHNGKTTDEADLRRRFADARALGANFIRLAHYPHHERAAEIADEVGMLLWAEIPVYWAIAFAAPDTYDDAENQLAELIRRDRNRASIIVWGVGNENADTDARLAFMAGLARHARALDPTRLVSAACLINRERFAIEDRLAEHLDIIGLNQYFGWYEPSLDGLRRLLANSDPGKPVVITEMGADALAGREGGEGELFTENHQVAVYREQFEILESAPYIKGICPWILYDFRTERRQTAVQRGWNLKGLIASDKATRKAVFEFVASRYRRIAQR